MHAWLRAQVHKKNEVDKGFTLIELLVVITILGILAAITVFSVAGVKDKGRNSAIAIDEATVRTAEEAYAASPTLGNGLYAQDLGEFKR